MQAKAYYQLIKAPEIGAGGRGIEKHDGREAYYCAYWVLPGRGERSRAIKQTNQDWIVRFVVLPLFPFPVRHLAWTSSSSSLFLGHVYLSVCLYKHGSHLRLVVALMSG